MNSLDSTPVWVITETMEYEYTAVIFASSNEELARQELQRRLEDARSYTDDVFLTLICMKGDKSVSADVFDFGGQNE